MNKKDIIKLRYQIPVRFSWNFMENHYSPKIPEHVQKELKDHDVSHEEYKRLITTGYLRKETDTEIIIAELQLIQREIMPDSLEDIVNKVIEEGLSDEWCDRIVSECILNGTNILELVRSFPDEDITYKIIALYLMDFLVSNDEKINEFVITIKPEEGVEE